MGKEEKMDDRCERERRRGGRKINTRAEREGREKK
jgi:hypothetical protein